MITTYTEGRHAARADAKANQARTVRIGSRDAALGYRDGMDYWQRRLGAAA